MGRTRGVAHAAWRWLPLAFAVLVCGVLLLAFGTPLGPVVLYAAYCLATAVVPGTLLWRLLRLTPKSFLEEVAAGTALGLAIQVFLTFVLGRVGAPPQWAGLWCVVVVVVCLGVPKLRKTWRSSATSPVPTWMSWALSVTSVVVTWAIANSGFRLNPLARVPGTNGQYFAPNPYIDMPFHQALAAAVLRGDYTFPYVPGVPLQYTLMVYEHLADFTRWTGTDLTLGVMRLSPVALAALAVVLCGVLAYRITGSPMAGTLSGGLAFLTDPASIYQGTDTPFGGVGNISSVYRSPTQTFGEPLFLVLVLLVVIVLRQRKINPWTFAAFAVLALVAGGSKATFLPLLFCGLALVLVLGWLLRRSVTVKVVNLIAIVAVAFAVSLLLIVGTDSRGLQFSNGTDLLSRMLISPALGPIIHDPAIRVVAIVLVVGVWILGVVGAVAATILRRRDLAVWLLVGIGIAGIVAAIAGTHPGLSQLYFLRGAWALLGVLSAIGFAELGRMVRSRRLTWTAVLASLAAGLVTALAVRLHTPLPGHYTRLPGTYLALIAPFAIVLGVALVVGAAAAFVAHLSMSRRQQVRLLAVQLGILVAIGLLQGTAFAEAATLELKPAPTPAIGEGVMWGVDIPGDGAEAARWLRTHSNSSDLVVTNQHCLDRVPHRSTCNPRQFWVSALAERNVLVEGWSYSTPSPQIAPGFTDDSPFWDQSLLAANDAAIYDPSPQTVAWLRSKSVKWVFVDRRVAPESPLLRNYLSLEFQRGDFAVYRVR